MYTKILYTFNMLIVDRMSAGRRVLNPNDKRSDSQLAGVGSRQVGSTVGYQHAGGLQERRPSNQPAQFRSSQFGSVPYVQHKDSYVQHKEPYVQHKEPYVQPKVAYIQPKLSSSHNLVQPPSPASPLAHVTSESEVYTPVPHRVPCLSHKDQAATPQRHPYVRL